MSSEDEDTLEFGWPIRPELKINIGGRIKERAMPPVAAKIKKDTPTITAEWDGNVLIHLWLEHPDFEVEGDISRIDLMTRLEIVKLSHQFSVKESPTVSITFNAKYLSKQG